MEQAEFDKEFTLAVNKARLKLPPKGHEARDRVLEIAREVGEELLDSDTLRHRHDNLWGFREVARFLGMSWKFVRKLAKLGIIPTLPEEEWVKGPVSVQRKHYKRTPLETKHTRTTREIRIVDLLFDPEQIKALDVEALQEKIAR